MSYSSEYEKIAHVEIGFFSFNELDNKENM